MADPAAQRLAMFISTLNCGGAERVTVNLLREAAERGFDLVLARAEGVFLRHVPAAVRVIELGVGKMQHGIPRLARYLRRERPRGIASMLTQANVTVLLARLLARVDTRVVAVEQSNVSEWIACGGIRPRIQWLARRLYPRADAVVGVSDGVARDVEHCFGLPAGRVRTIYNPIVDATLAQRATAESPHPWFESSDVPVLVSVGRLHSQKDHGTLLEAIRRVCKIRPVRLVIFGEGAERSRLEALRRELGLEQAVALPGMTDNPYAAMSRARLFVLSSRFEGLPTVLVEALACGCPAVATECPNGPAEILDQGRHGILVPVGNAEALAGAILTALDRPVDRESLQLRAADFSVARSLDGYLDALGCRPAMPRLVSAA